MNTKRLYITIIVSLLFIKEGLADYISLATTTSTENSGFLAYIIPIFEKKFNIKVRTIVQGTGQALETGRRGDADLLMVHAPAMEKKFIANGYGLRRYPFMFNDFVIIGPKEDPGEVQIANSSVQAFTKIYKKNYCFYRGEIIAVLTTKRSKFGKRPDSFQQETMNGTCQDRKSTRLNSSH